MFLTQLPNELEDGAALVKRRKAAEKRKEMWRSVYQDVQRYAMPARETFTWTTEGSYKNNTLYDTTLQDLCYTAANTMLAILFPPWEKWAEFAPGGAIRKEDLTPEIIGGLQKATKTLFDFLHTSNFSTVAGEYALDLLVGTAAIQMDEGDNETPFIFSSIPLSAIELEEGPNGVVETTFMLKSPAARNLMRTYPGMELMDLPQELAEVVLADPDKEIPVIQCEVYHPPNKHYYGIVVHEATKAIIWRYDYGKSCPKIVTRATKVSGELYGRGRAMLALSDAKTLDKMTEFVLRHSAMQVAPPYTAVSDGVLNPYTAQLQPNTMLPVASNDNGNPSLRVLEIGGNFQIGDVIMENLRSSLRRKMLGPDLSDGAIKSATEISVSDRNRLWSMGGEYARVQFEGLAKILARGAFILQRKGLMPKFDINGRSVAIKYTSPFAKSQNAEEIAALLRTVQAGDLMSVGPEVVKLGLKVEDIPAWIARKEGVDEDLIRSPDEKQKVVEQATQAAAALTEAEDPNAQQPAE
jgi:hypothetical protein